MEEKRRKYAELQKKMNNLIKEGEKASELLNNKIQQLSEIKLNIQKIKAENEKKKRIEKNLKIKIDKVKESNKYMSGFIQENSVHDTSTSFVNKQNKFNQKKILEEINTESNININGINNENNKRELINNESVISNVVKQTQNEINVTGPVTSNNSILLNNKENSLGINGSEQSKLNEAEDYNMKEISGIMKSILED